MVEGPLVPEDPAEHRRDPSWRCTVLDPFTSRDYRYGIGTYRRCPACEAEEAAFWAKYGDQIKERPRG